MVRTRGAKARKAGAKLKAKAQMDRPLFDRYLPPPRRRMLLKAASFASIGVVNALVDFAIFMALVKWGGLSLLVANLLSWAVAVSGSYVMNTMITFSAESGRQLRLADYGRFVLSGAAGAAANTAAVLGFALVMSLALAKILAIGVSFVVNFSMSHFFVFRARPDAPRALDRS